MGGGDIDRKKKPDVIIPDVGAAKYWYVDPRAKDYESNQQQLNQWGVQPPPPPDGTTAVIEALSRIGVMPEGTQPSF